MFFTIIVLLKITVRLGFKDQIPLLRRNSIWAEQRANTTVSWEIQTFLGILIHGSGVATTNKTTVINLFVCFSCNTSSLHVK